MLMFMTKCSKYSYGWTNFKMFNYNERFKIFSLWSNKTAQNINDKLNVQIIHGWTLNVQNVPDRKFKIFMAEQNVRNVHGWTKCSKCLWRNKMFKDSWTKRSKYSWLNKMFMGEQNVQNVSWLNRMFKIFMVEQNVRNVHGWTKCSKYSWLNKSDNKFSNWNYRML